MHCREGATGEGVTHHAGCYCHEKRHKNAIAKLKKERDKAIARNDQIVKDALEDSRKYGDALIRISKLQEQPKRINQCRIHY